MNDAPIDGTLPALLLRLGYQYRTQSGTEVIVPPLCPIPAGSFLMGSAPQRDPDAWTIELPQHRVSTRVYAIAKYPLTVAEYACAVRCGGARALATTWVAEWAQWEAQLRTPTYPVVNVGWADALAYVRWLSDVTGEQWRLPTEAEWEKAARGTDGRIYPWGDHFDPRMANTFETNVGRTTPVDAYACGASPYGVVDLIGNVYEWCSSAWRPYPYEPLDGREDLHMDVPQRIARGGSYADYANNARAATRWPLKPRVWGGPQGARLVRDRP